MSSFPYGDLRYGEFLYDDQYRTRQEDRIEALKRSEALLEAGHETPDILLNAVLGRYLGGGASRIVFEYLPATTHVIKLEVSPSLQRGHFQNVIEYRVWQDLRSTPWGKRWLMPISYLSRCGRVLIMRRGRKPDVRDGEAQQEALSKFKTLGLLNDIHEDNWCVDPTDGRMKLADYGFVALANEDLLELAEDDGVTTKPRVKRKQKERPVDDF